MAGDLKLRENKDRTAPGIRSYALHLDLEVAVGALAVRCTVIPGAEEPYKVARPGLRDTVGRGQP